MENEDTVLIETELVKAEHDSVCLLFREKEIVRDTVVETNWEAGESNSEFAMVIVASVKVGKTWDVIFSGEKDVLIIDVGDENGFWINVDALEPPKLSGCENETVRFSKRSPVEYVEETRYEELLGRTDGVRSDTVAMLLSSDGVDEILDVAVSNSDICKDGVSVSATELLPEGVMVVVTNTGVVESMVVAVTLKEDDVNVEPIVFSRVEDSLRSETPLVETFIYSDDGII